MRSLAGFGRRLVIFLHRPDGPYFTDWDWSETHPLGGSESSAIHLAREFCARGFSVLVTNRIDDLRQPCDIFVSTRTWQVFHLGIRPGRINYLWCTDDTDQPSLEKLRDPTAAAQVYRHIDAAMLISDYQAERWMAHLHLPANKVFMTTNGIETARFSPDIDQLDKRRPAAYYGSTPYRGLALLLQCWPQIRRAVPAAELHIFSSMKIYGVEDSREFMTLYETARATSGVCYHGAQGQAVIRATTRECRALAYPCIFPETSCITAMEAMASGCAIVSTTTGALPETAAGNPLVAPDAGWLDRWQEEVIRVFTDDGYYLKIARHNLDLSSRRDWGSVAEQWIERFVKDAKNSTH